MTGVIVVDIETRSFADLKKVGAWRYAADPSTGIWCVGYAVNDEPVQLWKPGEPVPAALIVAVNDPNTVWIAHNAAFERAIFQHILVPRHGWPNIPLECWRCTMAASLALALPASLDKAAQVLRLPQQKANKDIVHRMAKPRQPRGDEDPKGIYWFDDPERLEALCVYCKQDVATERELWRRLSPLSAAEQELWQLDQIINERGYYADGVLAEKAIAIATATYNAVQDEIKQITGGAIETTNQVEKLIAWLAAHGCEVKDLQKGTLAHALRRKGLAPEVRRVIELRRQAAHASANKFQALLNWRCVDGRIRGSFKYCGAATGRWSAGGPQPQNFKREADTMAATFAAVMGEEPSQ
jgi:DNA polymerase